MTRRARVVTLLGAESTGKTSLAQALCETLAAGGRRVARVEETLREFCDREGRTPRRDEQVGIAEEQSRRIDRAADTHDLVIADTTALLTAVYSDWVFGDASLYPAAESTQAGYSLTLVTALDLPWQADGLQRDGPQVRAPVDELLRLALARAGCGYSVIAGQGPDRSRAALASVARVLSSSNAPTTSTTASRRWHSQCERCGDPACERGWRSLPG